MINSDQLFALFIHYNLKRPRDWDWDPTFRTRVILKEAGKERLDRDITSLLPLLDPGDDGWRGFAFIFLDPGWSDLVKGSRGMGAVALGASLYALQQQLTTLVPDRPVRLVSAFDLIELLQILEGGSEQSNLQDILIGPRGQLRYDSVKVIEAVIRIANFSRNVPIFRFDDDVIFPRTDKPQEDKQNAITRQGILALCRHFNRLTTNPNVHYFVFSGSYLEPTRSQFFECLHQPSSEASANQLVSSFDQSSLDAALNGFATRVVQLAKIPDLRYVAEIDADKTSDEIGNALRQKPWIAPDASDEHLDLGTVRWFLNELWEIGANPFRQVISGAGLCLSDSAILDLPPFSNMRDNVMWIDDHLKFALHHELGHFGFPSAAATGIGVPLSRPAIGRIADAWFRQERHSSGVTLGDVRWHTANYLPRLLRGAIADAWLREDPRLKLPAQSFDRQEWKTILESADGTFASHFVRMLRNPTGASDVPQQLWERALERLNRIVVLWSNDIYRDTFLHLVTVGKAQTSGGTSPYSHTFDRWHKLGFLPEISPQGLAEAVANLPRSRPNQPPQAGSLAALVYGLLEDFLAYVELVRFWRNFVQATRFLLNERPQDFFWPFPIPYYQPA